jgi:hypothetical protein
MPSYGSCLPVLGLVLRGKTGHAPFRTTPQQSIAYMVIGLPLPKYSRSFVSIRDFSSSLNAGYRRVLN